MATANYLNVVKRNEGRQTLARTDEPLGREFFS